MLHVESRELSLGIPEITYTPIQHLKLQVNKKMAFKRPRLFKKHHEKDLESCDIYVISMVTHSDIHHD